MRKPIHICERFTCSWINKAAWGRTSFKKRRLSALCSQNSTLDPVRKRRLLSTNLLSLCRLNKKARAWFRLKNIRRVPPPGFFPTRWETSNWATVDFYWLYFRECKVGMGDTSNIFLFGESITLQRHLPETIWFWNGPNRDQKQLWIKDWEA